MTWILAGNGSRFILVLDDDASPNDLPIGTMGRILDAEEGELYPPERVHSLIRHNPYLGEYTGPQDILSDLLDKADEVEFE